MPNYTAEQRRAIETTDRSLLVSAAAGSGKTSVLAERCARLIAGADGLPPCAAADVLVVTFTEAAAAEMRARIGEALRRVLDTTPRRRHVEEQIALLVAAPISTIHSFCFDLIRRWFSRAGIDPQCAILDAEEALLLRHETLEAMLSELYGQATAEARAFQRLVETDYGGDDSTLVEQVLAMHDFVRSLPASRRWLIERADLFAGARGDDLAKAVHRVRRQRLETELARQRDWLAPRLGGWPEEAFEHCGQLREMRAYREHLDRWLTATRRAATPEQLDAVTNAILDTQLNAAGTKTKKMGLSGAQHERAKRIFGLMKRRLSDRLQQDVAAFTGAEYVDGLERMRESRQVLTSLLGRFDERYEQAKRADNLLDFADLEQKAFAILCEDADPNRPSEVARQCHARYRHVLVDEFQDVNPVQEAILHLVSRESGPEPTRPPNLFAVGDVKQSIYAFRLAAPSLFAERARRFRDGKAGELIPLSHNFRSRPQILRAVNALFEQCMREEFADVAYDDAARLRQGRTFPPEETDDSFAGIPVELHLLSLPSRSQEAAEEEAESENTGSAADGADRESFLERHRVEREAYLIGRRIRELMGGEPGHPKRQVLATMDEAAGRPPYRPLEYRDIVILLRTMTNKADRLAGMLRQMGIPVRADARSGYFETAELRDMVSLLSLLDNARQDIPLAAVLRSPLARPEPFTADDLARIRFHRPRAPFHEAAEAYACGGEDADLRDRLRTFAAAIDRMRAAARRSSLADVIWEIYETTGYLAYVGGLPNGAQRRANLIGLHDRARQFGTFRKQGLRRFLRFIEQLRHQEEDLAPPSAASEADNVVRVMSVHQSKGLEFPVVFVADLGAKFNTSDLTASVVLHREHGIGMKVVDAERRIRYPTLAYQTAVDARRKEMLAEELRILYVAVTRAREHLILVGSDRDSTIAETLGTETPETADLLTLETANKPLDWVFAALRGMSVDERPIAAGLATPERSDVLFAVAHYRVGDIDAWEVPDPMQKARRSYLANLARLDPLSPDEPVAVDDDEVRNLIQRIDYLYPPTALTTLAARKAVTELKQAFDPFTDADERPRERIDVARLELPRFAAGGAGAISPAERGTLTHRFLQLVDLTLPADEASLQRQLADFIRSGRMPEEAGPVVDTAAAAWFFDTDLGQRLRRAADRVEREAMFVTRVSPTVVDATVSPLDAGDYILVRGMVDAMWPVDGGVEILDYKTDAVDGNALEDRIRLYRSQVELYARAVTDIWRREVRARWLVFLAARRIVPV